MKITVIHQPEYLPFLGFFDRVAMADILFFLDDVGYQKNGFINRNKIKTANGWQWITIPVKGRSPNQKINEVLIDNTKKWAQDHWKAMIYNYSKAPHFNDYASFFEDIFRKEWMYISELDVYLVEKIVDFLGLKIKIKKASEEKIPGQKSERLVNICKGMRADTYLSGPGGKSYMDLAMFQKENINVIFHDFTFPTYNQQFMNKGFVPGLSIIDLLFNYGPEALNIIQNKKL